MFLFFVGKIKVENRIKMSMVKETEGYQKDCIIYWDKIALEESAFI